MSYAVEYLNYEGQAHAMCSAATPARSKIVHRVEDGRVTERITSEDAGREIIRKDDEVTCIFPDQRTVLVEERDDAGQVAEPAARPPARRRAASMTLFTTSRLPGPSASPAAMPR